MKRILVLALVAAGCGPTTSPGIGSPPDFAPTPAPPVDAQHYAQDTPEQTRAAHRTAVGLLKESKWAEAFETVEDVQPRELRRSLTEYLQLVAAVRLPEEALYADRYAHVASRIEVGPGLLSEQRKSLDQHRAWIAAIQDVMADEAVRRDFQRPRPENLQNTHNSGLLAAWDSRGPTYDAATYNATKARFSEAVSSTLDVKLAMSDVFTGITPFNVHYVLFVDLTPFRFDFQPPPLVLPAEANL